MKRTITTALLALTMTGAAVAEDRDAKVVKRIGDATAVLQELMRTPDKSVPLDIAAKATCVVVVPAFKKAAFVFGGEYGQGLATCRTPKGWSAPVFLQMSGASFGFQIGGQSTDLVLVGTDHRSAQDLLKAKIKLGGDIAASAGPVGRNSQAATTELANAEFLTYSRSKGLFAGIDLNGDEVNQNTKDTEAFYGKDVSYDKILSGAVPTPPEAARFTAAVRRLFRQGRAAQ